MQILELAHSFGMPIESIAFERGIVLRPRSADWLAHSACAGGEVAVSIDDVARSHRPVLIRLEPRFEVMLRPDGDLARMLPGFGAAATLFNDLEALRYLGQALVHHVAGMIREYERACDSCRTDCVRGRISSPRLLYSGQPGPYYEFDALLGAVRRSYDACRYPLWKVFGTDSRSMPRSLKSLLSTDSRLKPSIKQALEESWAQWGERVTMYRDCIHHYVPLDFGASSIDMQADPLGVWTAHARIPDNPEARSKPGFAFSGGLDALTFGWHAAVEAARILGVVAAEVMHVVALPPPASTA